VVEVGLGRGQQREPREHGSRSVSFVYWISRVAAGDPLVVGEGGGAEEEEALLRSVLRLPDESNDLNQLRSALQHPRQIHFRCRLNVFPDSSSSAVFPPGCQSAIVLMRERGSASTFKNGCRRTARALAKQPHFLARSSAPSSFWPCSKYSKY
jgi:hypothetical protein